MYKIIPVLLISSACFGLNNSEASWQVRFDSLLSSLNEDCRHKEACVRERWDSIKDNAALFLLGEPTQSTWSWAKGMLLGENPLSSEKEIARAILTIEQPEQTRKVF